MPPVILENNADKNLHDYCVVSTEEDIKSELRGKKHKLCQGIENFRIFTNHVEAVSWGNEENQEIEIPSWFATIMTYDIGRNIHMSFLVVPPTQLPINKILKISAFVIFVTIAIKMSYSYVST